MMRRILIASMFVLLLLMFGCAKEPVVEDTAPVAEADVVVDVTEPAPEAETDAMVAAGGEVLSDIACDREARTVVFTISNTGSEDWYLERVSAFDITEKTPAKVSITGKVVSDLDVICDKAILPAGEEVTCTQAYDETSFARRIRLKNGDLGRLDYNTLRLQTPDINEVIQFDC